MASAAAIGGMATTYGPRHTTLPAMPYMPTLATSFAPAAYLAHALRLRQHHILTCTPHICSRLTTLKKSSVSASSEGNNRYEDMRVAGGGGGVTVGE